MSENRKLYEAPRMRIFQFSGNDNNGSLLSQSGGSGGDSPADAQVGAYAADALNHFFNGTTTTIEK